MTALDWWRDDVVAVPRPIPPGTMVGMRSEQRNGKLLIVEFLEPVPQYQAPRTTRRARRRIALKRNSDQPHIAWSRDHGFTILNGIPLG